MSHLRNVLDAGWENAWNCPDFDPSLPTSARFGSVVDAGFVRLAIPEDFHGFGASMLEVASAQRELGRRDPGTAIALNMHSFTVGVLTEYWSKHQDHAWFVLEGIAETGSLVASAFAEPGGSANMMEAKSVAVPFEKGYRLSGTKAPCSLATTADLFCISARVPGSGNTIVALCPAKSPGISVVHPWDSIGMIGSDTATVRFDEVEIDDRLVFHSGPADGVDSLVVAGIVWFVTLLAASYHGAMTTLLERTAGSKSLHDGRGRSLFGSAVRALTSLGAGTQRLILQWSRGEFDEEVGLTLAISLRAELSECRDRLVKALTPLLGGRVFTASAEGPLALDLLAVHHHPPSLISCDESLGFLAAGRTPPLTPEHVQEQREQDSCQQ